MLSSPCVYLSTFFYHRAINIENDEANNIKNVFTGNWGPVPETARDYKVILCISLSLCEVMHLEPVAINLILNLKVACILSRDNGRHGIVCHARLHVGLF